MNTPQTDSYEPAVRIDTVSVRLLDLMASGLLLIAMLPLLAICCIAVRATFGGPILEHRERQLANGRKLEMLRFRTSGHDGRGGSLKKWLRFTRIEDLPRVFDVLRGQLSLIGPEERRAFRD